MLAQLPLQRVKALSSAINKNEFVTTPACQRQGILAADSGRSAGRSGGRRRGGGDVYARHAGP